MYFPKQQIPRSPNRDIADIISNADIIFSQKYLRSVLNETANEQVFSVRNLALFTHLNNYGIGVGRLVLPLARGSQNSEK